MKVRNWFFHSVLICVLLLPIYVAAETLDQIVSGAKKEGKVKTGVTVRWEVGGKPMAKKIVEVFRNRYPFMQVEFERVGGSRERERILSELAAGRVNYDVAVISETQAPTAVKANVIEAVDWKSLGVPADLIYPGSIGVNYRTQVYGIVYNRKLIPDEVGQKLVWDDCVDPKWKGKVGMDTRPRHLEMLWQPQAWGKEKTLAHARKLGENGTIFQRDRTGTMTSLALGEYPIVCGAFFSTYLEQSKFRGASHLGFTPGDPVLISAGDVVYAPRGAPHPNAAKLWITWSVSEEGQTILDEVQGSGNPYYPGTEAAKMMKGKRNVIRYEDKWVVMSGQILREILEAAGLPVGR